MSDNARVNGCGRERRPEFPPFPSLTRPEPVVSGASEPVIYGRAVKPGTCDQFAVFLGSVVGLVNGEPRETFASAGVRAAAWHLSRLLTDRAEQGEAAETAGDGQ